MKKIASFLLLFTYAYAVIRYHYGKNVPFHEWLYVLNKAFSWTGFTLIGLSILPKSWFDQCHLVRKEAGIIAYSFCILHLLINFSLMNSTRYPFLYLSTNEWSWQGIFTLILGSLSFCCFTIALIGSINIFGSNETKKRKLLFFGKIGFFIALFHPLVMSYNRWFTGKWPYYLPPITLIAVVSGGVFFYLRWNLKHKAK